MPSSIVKSWSDNPEKARWIDGLVRRGIRYGICVLEVCKAADDLEKAERTWIARGRVDGWALLNVSPGGASPMLGRHHSAETKEKIRRANSGRVFSASWREHIAIAKMNPRKETREKLSEATKRRLAGGMPEETRARISAGLKGRAFSPEHRAKIGEANRKRLGTRYRQKVPLIYGRE